MRVYRMMMIAMLLASAAMAGDPESRVLNKLCKITDFSPNPNAPSTMVVEARPDESALAWQYTLLPVNSWGSYVTMEVTLSDRVIGLKDWSNLTLEIKPIAGGQGPVVLRLTVYDKDQSGAVERWYRDYDDLEAKGADAEWRKIVVPLDRLILPPREWKWERNDGVFDRTRVVQIEISIVTTKSVEASGTVLMRNLCATNPK